MALAAIVLAAPASAQDRWSHRASGITLPARFEGLAIVEQRDLGTSNDSMANYEAASSVESTTVYVFKASVPHARLWFDRAMPTVASDIPMDLFEAGPVERVAVGGAAPGGLRQVFEAKQAGPFRTTALVVAQSGPWIIKVRATSATLDRAGLTGRLDRLFAAMAIPAPAFAPSLDAPPPCPVPPRFGTGQRIDPDPVTEIDAAAVALMVGLRLQGSDPDLCQAGRAEPRFTLVGSRTRPASWLLLVGDAGRAIGSQPLDADGKPGPQLVHVVTPAGLRVAAVFDAPPTLEAAVAAAAPLLRDPSAAGLLGVGGGGKAR